LAVSSVGRGIGSWKGKLGWGNMHDGGTAVFRPGSRWWGAVGGKLPSGSGAPLELVELAARNKWKWAPECSLGHGKKEIARDCWAQRETILNGF
jgi:hypothetical protein